MGDHQPSRNWPGLGLMALLTAMLVACGFWAALHRTTRVDESLADNPNAASVRWPDMRVDINEAGIAELALLPGVGERLAQRVVQDREAHGRFTSLDDLQRVPGMGAATIDRLRPYAMTAASAPESLSP